jgi:hypothetical protein
MHVLKFGVCMYLNAHTLYNRYISGCTDKPTFFCIVVFGKKSHELQLMNHNSHFLPGKDVYYGAASSGIMSEKKQPNNMSYLLVFTSQ